MKKFKIDDFFTKGMQSREPNSVENMGKIEEIKSLKINWGWNWKYLRLKIMLKNTLEIKGSFWNFIWVKLNWFIKSDAIDGLIEQTQKIESLN